MKIEHEILISAPPDLVWAVTVDVERWPEWTPTVKRVRRLGDEAFGVGSPVEILQPGLPPVTWAVTEFSPPRLFAWEGRLRGLRMVATHELSACDEGTRNVLRIEMGGFLAALLGPLLRWSAGRALRQENLGLAARCEPEKMTDSA